MHSFFRKSKDVTLAAAARFAVNSRLRGIGQMTELSIDTKKRCILLRLELVGDHASPWAARRAEKADGGASTGKGKGRRRKSTKKAAE